MNEIEDMFGEKRITIKGDSKLNAIAQLLYDINNRKPEIVKNGESIGSINRHLHYEVLCESGILPIIKSGSTEQFKEWYLSKEYPTEEECARAFRELVKENHILLGRDVILAAEEHRRRIASNMKKPIA